MIKEPYYESKIYMGCVKSRLLKPIYKREIRENEVRQVIGEQQESYHIVIPLRITKTRFVAGSVYQENGWEIAAINYPRTNTTVQEIDDFMLILAKVLLNKFYQHRVSIVNPREIIMLTGEDDLE